MASRRTFIGGILGLAAGSARIPAWAQGLEQFGSSAPPCSPDQRLTPSVPRDATYREGAPLRTSIVESGTPGTPITLQGTLSGITCGRIRGAELHFWQADPSGRYDPAGYRFRGRQVTDSQGHYRLTTVVPGSSGGRAPHIGVRVRIESKPDFWTEIFFPNQPLNAKDARFRQELVMTRTADGATFDITLNL